MKKKKNQLSLSRPLPKTSNDRSGLWRDGIVIDTTDEVFSGGICLDFSKIK